MIRDRNELIINGDVAQPMARYSDMQLRVLDKPNLQMLKIDFAAFYKRAVLMYLRGVLASGEDGPRS